MEMKILIGVESSWEINQELLLVKLMYYLTHRMQYNGLFAIIFPLPSGSLDFWVTNVVEGYFRMKQAMRKFALLVLGVGFLLWCKSDVCLWIRRFKVPFFETSIFLRKTMRLSSAV